MKKCSCGNLLISNNSIKIGKCIFCRIKDEKADASKNEEEGK